MSTERRLCQACGANNFSTQQSCWSCNASLITTNESVISAAQMDDPMVIPAIAVVILSLLTPFVSLCVGFVFLMLSGRRNTTLGWWNVIAGVLGSVLHVVALAFLLPAVTSGVLTKTLTGLSQQRQQNDVNQSQSILSGQEH
jgi:hypothetical protein